MTEGGRIRALPIFYRARDDGRLSAPGDGPEKEHAQNAGRRQGASYF